MNTVNVSRSREHARTGICSVLALGVLFALLAAVVAAVPANAAPDVAIEKIAGEPEWSASEIEAGDSAVFTIEVTNNEAIPTDITINDPLPGGTELNWEIWAVDPWEQYGACSIVDGEAGPSLSCNFTGIPGEGGSVTVIIGAETGIGRCATWPNTATATATDETGTTNVSDSATVTCSGPDLTLTKTPGKKSVVAGEDVTFTIELSNAGPGTLYPWQVRLEDILPDGAAGRWEITDGPSDEEGDLCSIDNWEGEGGSQDELYCGNLGELGPGESVSITLKAPTSTEFCSTYSNTATVREQGRGRSAGRESEESGPGIQAFAWDEPFELNAEATVTCRQPAPGLMLTKTAVKPTVSAGEDVVFEILTSSTGDIAAGSATLSDPLPGGTAGPWSITVQPEGNPCSIVGGKLVCSFGDLPVGQSRTVSVKAPTSETNCGTYANTATASASGVPDVSGQATVTCVKPPPVPTPPVPKLQLRLTANRTVARPGQKVRYTVSVRNQRKGSVSRNLNVCSGVAPMMVLVNHGGGRFQDGRICWTIKRLKGNGGWVRFHYTAKVQLNAGQGKRLPGKATVKNLSARWNVKIKVSVKPKRQRHTPVTG